MSHVTRLQKKAEQRSAVLCISLENESKIVPQGGTCVVIGDEHAKVTEAAKAAERHLKCKAFRSSPFWRKEGFSQDMHNKEVSTWVPEFHSPVAVLDIVTLSQGALFCSLSGHSE